MKASVGVILLGALASACVRTHVTRLNTAVALPPTCEAGVALFFHDSVPDGPHIEIARITISYYSDAQPTVGEEQRVQRKKAAELGATGLALSQARDQKQAADAASIAIFAPSDSARVAKECRSQGRSL